MVVGNNLVSLDFNGNQIANSIGGPFLVKYVTVICGTAEATASTLFETQSFSAAQFTFVPSDFTIAVETSPASASPGSTFICRIFVTAAGPFSAPVHLTVGGLPAGATASFNIPTILGFGPSYLTVVTISSTPPGTYPLTISGVSGTLAHTAAAALILQAP